MWGWGKTSFFCSQHLYEGPWPMTVYLLCTKRNTKEVLRIASRPEEHIVSLLLCCCSPSNHGAERRSPSRHALASRPPCWQFQPGSSSPYLVFLQTKLLGLCELRPQFLQPPLQDGHLLILPLHVGRCLLPQPVQVQLQLHHVCSRMRQSEELGLPAASSLRCTPACGLPFMMLFFCSDTASSSRRKSFTRFW